MKRGGLVKPFSRISISIIIFGVIMLGTNGLSANFNELIGLIGLISCLFGVVFSYVAIAKKEKGSLKYISITSFFLVLLWMVLLEPFQLIRILTWMKN